MSEIMAEVNYGMWAAEGNDAYCVKNFPHSRNFVLGGCLLLETKKAPLFVCPECVAGCERYKREHPEADKD